MASLDDPTKREVSFMSLCLSHGILIVPTSVLHVWHGSESVGHCESSEGILFRGFTAYIIQHAVQARATNPQSYRVELVTE